MQRLPPLIGLRAFESAARHGSFKRAADELGVTPTAVSHQIRLLEDHCGVRLFRRRPRPLTLTEAGKRLFPSLREGFARIAAGVAEVRVTRNAAALKVTTTSAFAARWLMPRLAAWRQEHPDIGLDVISTYDVLDLEAGEADIAIRYARNPPADGLATELFRDRFCLVASPRLLGGDTQVLPGDLARYPRIETGWPPQDLAAPTWRRWEAAARQVHAALPSLADRISLRFEEELHAIESVIAGQGIAICSDVLIAPELADGKLVQLSDVVLPGYGFYLVHSARRSRDLPVRLFTRWAQDLARV